MTYKKSEERFNKSFGLIVRRHGLRRLFGQSDLLALQIFDASLKSLHHFQA